LLAAVAKIEWSPRALRDIERLHDFLVRKNPAAAANAIETLRQGSHSLIEHPEIGKPMQDMPSEFREWPVPFAGSSYLLFYRFDGERVVILAVRHGRELGY
jgi:addiction module RelE/StbE family toxin